MADAPNGLRGFTSKNKAARILGLTKHGIQREIEKGRLGLVDVAGQRMIPVWQLQARYHELYGGEATPFADMMRHRCKAAVE